MLTTIARQGIVLLKNENNILPLSIDTINSNKLKIAIIGPNANATQTMLSNYQGKNILVNSHSPMNIISTNVINTSYASGCPFLNCTDTNGFADAVNLAKESDISIVFLGLCPGTTPTCNGPSTVEREGLDRSNISFPGYQLELLKQVYDVNPNKTILVLINGGAIDLTWPKESGLPAIIEAFYPGELGGDAIYDVLFGNVSPAGKLPFTIYDQSLIHNRPYISDMNLRNNGGITYRYYQGTPVYEFGFGLSYTTFEYQWSNYNYNYNGGEKEKSKLISTKKMANYYWNKQYFYKAVDYEVTVKNTGNVGSDCVVLGFVSSNHTDSPIKKLFDFQRVYVGVGQSVNVTLSVSPESISLTNTNGHERIVPGFYQVEIGEVGQFLMGYLKMNGDEETIFKHKMS